MRLLLAESTAADRYRVALVVVFGALATLLASAGVFGVTANMVAQRTREIGIRTALGAQKSNVLGLVVRSGLSYALVGSVIGLLAAMVGSRLIASYLFGVEQWDPLAYGGVAALLLLVALTSSYVPARRATNVDPITVLCEE
jgi:ABC-type antimicrobial peptide transport system permease subunit